MRAFAIAPYLLRVQGFIATLRRVLVMVIAIEGLPSAVRLDEAVVVTEIRV